MDENLPRIPGYRIDHVLGRGAMAAVYLAIQENLDRQVALKIMAGSLAADASFCDRFLKEGKIVAQLNHPHIVTIYDIGTVQNHYYMAMEYIPGETLKQCIPDGGMPPQQAIELVCQVASALGYAHKRGFVHRDVKPANVLLRDDGSAVLSDFGIAKALGGGGTQMTAVGFTVGTPNYMSPEQALGKTLDGRSDLYSLGIMLFEMLSGHRPFEAEDSFSTALMHVNNPVPRLPLHLARWQDPLDKLLAKDPKDRFADAEELIRTLRNLPATRQDDDSGATRIAPAWVGPQGSGAAVLKDTDMGSGSGLLRALRNRRLWWGLGTVLGLPLLIAVAYPLLGPLVTDGPAGPESPPVDCPALDPQLQARVDLLLSVAGAHQEVGRLADPPGSNALDAYQRVLELDPCSEVAQRGLQNIADGFLAMARESLEEGNGDTARRQVETGLRAVPRHPGLVELRQRLEEG